jgi:hypothetical protein
MNLLDLLVIKVGPYEIRGELLILIGIMTWIIIASVCFSCLKVRFGIEEGFDMIKNVVENGADAMKRDAPIYTAPKMPNDLNMYPRTNVSPADNLAVSSIKSEMIGATVETGVGAEYKQTVGYTGFQFPTDSMDIMATTSFKPDCCPSVYSSSIGCACLSNEQRTFIAERGGSNYPIAEY